MNLTAYRLYGVILYQNLVDNIKPDKEKSTEKIDGVVVMIMALDRVIRCGNAKSESVYDSRGVPFYITLGR